MVLYGYRCENCGDIERSFRMGEAPSTVVCDCGEEAKRCFTVGLLQCNGAGRPSNAEAFNKEMTQRNERAGKRMRKEHGESPVKLVAHDYGGGDVREVKK